MGKSQNRCSDKQRATRRGDNIEWYGENKNEMRWVIENPTECINFAKIIIANKTKEINKKEEERIVFGVKL